MTTEELRAWQFALLVKIASNNALSSEELHHIAFCFGAVWMAAHGEREKKSGERG